MEEVCHEICENRKFIPFHWKLHDFFLWCFYIKNYKSAKDHLILSDPQAVKEIMAQLINILSYHI